MDKEQRRKERIDRGIKVRTDGLYAVMSWRELAYLIAPRFVLIAGLLILPVCGEALWMPWEIAAAGVYGLYVLQVYIQLRRVGSFHPAAGLFFPVLFLFFVLIK